MDSSAEFDRGAVTDIALAMFLARGFGSTTLDDIAEASGFTVETVARVFPTRESFVLGVADDMLDSAVKHLAEGEQDEDLVDALTRAHKEMLRGIIDGTGSVPLQRMQQMGLLAMASPTLATAISERRKETLPLALADHYGMDPEDPLILRTVRVWSAVVSGTYAAGIGDHADTEPERDLDDTKRMTRRLDHAFKHITGRSEY
ncbi:AcrR family transcriptional regulator [Mycolicibacterium sp. BK556]|uniref:TetR/AcrR family transcriptional regulator n=1 Tax=unclassified Mycolicibacterium TaxID=2636767 RepID=UPI00161826BF|nr:MULTISPECIES: TetR/AcrR family transcriptional regulator [unclassified Mycolicibacterium]MBB3602672.1 AcrR family transcriptional regulator [Mycolicibacterium sp. BK556]MBB3632424.1 AcrR family transcriptional regulator [Mycolicibacterium sp. BK607]